MPEPTRKRLVAGAAAIAAALLLPASPQAFGGDRLRGTGGVMQVEGTGGGGVVPWALITGLGTNRQIGFSAYCSRVAPDDFALDVCGAALGFYDRVELSVARQRFDLGETVPGERIEQDVIGVKVRLLGDAVSDQDRWYPQLAIGAQFKRNRDFTLVPALLGARRDSDVDYYLAASKLYLGGLFGRNLLVNGTLRATRANQFGLLGFGGDRGDSRRLMPELSAGVFLTDEVVIGAEWRDKPDLLSVFREDPVTVGYVAWLPSRHLSITGAWVDLGNIADRADQAGWYLSLQGTF